MILIEIGMKGGAVFRPQIEISRGEFEKSVLAKPVIQVQSQNESLYVTASEVAFVRIIDVPNSEDSEDSEYRK